MAAKKVEEIKNEQEIIEEAAKLAESEAEVPAEETEEKQEGKLKKFGAGVKKHGKRLVVGTLAVIGGATVVMKVLSGKKVDEVDDVEETSDDVKVEEF